MPAISRNVVDLAKTGHGCTAVIGVRASQGSVFANGIPVLRRGDRCLPHTIPVCCPLRCIPHPAKVNMGSPTVFVKNVPVARSRDSTDMGALFMGSHNVFANGAGGGFLKSGAAGGGGLLGTYSQSAVDAGIQAAEDDI